MSAGLSMRLTVQSSCEALKCYVHCWSSYFLIDLFLSITMSCSIRIATSVPNTPQASSPLLS